MNWLDFVIVVFLLLTIVMGFKRGLLRALAPLLAIVLATLFAGLLQGPLADKLPFLSSERSAHIVAFVLVFIILLVTLNFVALILQKIVQMTLLGWVDRLGGAVFGLVSGWILCTVLVLLVARYWALPADLPAVSDNSGEVQGIRHSVYNTLNDSKIASFQIESFPFVVNLLPDEFGDVRDFFNK